ncbi:YaaC family protein [Xanthobacter versatilis]|uniref:YaaC family protein n=1 Tax=Xanthobacter autotrophicus (strain ATCC BAA-1158 / Py2) TaxID=78245 RepID=UPI0037266770
MTLDQTSNPKLRLLRNDAQRTILDSLASHGWTAKITRESYPGEYLIIEAERGEARRRLAFFYSSATDNRHYQVAAQDADIIFHNGEPYKLESFAYGIQVPVRPVKTFYATLLEWNQAFDPARADSGSAGPLPARPSRVRHLTAEDPLAAIWTRLDQLQSVRLARKVVTRRCADAGIQLEGQILDAKAEGVAFCVRNAADYFRGPQTNLGSRVLALYYGILSFACAEMLADPVGRAGLSEVEAATKRGHGLYTVPADDDDLGELGVGVSNAGFYPAWVRLLTPDVGAFPKTRATTAAELVALPAEFRTTLRDLLAAVPELGDLYAEVFDGPPAWITPVYDMEANGAAAGQWLHGSGASYIHLLDTSGRIDWNMAPLSAWPFAEPMPIKRSDERSALRVRVDHPGYESWHEALPLHRSAFLGSTSLIFPGLVGAGRYRVLAFATAYALSIVVRYLPSTWRRVDGGDWDHYRALIAEAVTVFARVLPEEFLEAIAGDRVVARMPGAFM